MRCGHRPQSQHRAAAGCRDGLCHTMEATTEATCEPARPGMQSFLLLCRLQGACQLCRAFCWLEDGAQEGCGAGSPYEEL